jgi:hypothetical protein
MIETEAVSEAAPGDTNASVRERLARGSIAQRSWRPQRGNDLYGGGE